VEEVAVGAVNTASRMVLSQCWIGGLV